MVDPWVLKQIAFPPPASYYLPTTLPNGKVRPPQINERLQEVLRETCLIAGLDPVKHMGLPEVKKKERLSEKLPLGPQTIVSQYQREKKILENLAQMDERIAQYRRERRQAKEDAKSEMPF
ncbi:hypothetical protein HDV00_009872 [Rhizophlyctis rosea]|nr:hypothetical protein HDV00_009872 [Rhizophlyctis rosea]